MRAIAVVVPRIAAQDTLEVACVYDQQAVEAFRSDRSHEAFGVSVGVGGPKRRAQHLSASGGKHSVEAPDVLGVAVSEEERHLHTLVLEIARDVSRLLGDPACVRMGSDPGDPDPSAAELNEEEHVEPLEHDGVDGEEVGSDEARCLGSQERSRRWIGSSGGGPEAVIRQDAGDRAPSQPDAELDQLPLDPEVAPSRILYGQTYDKGGGLLIHGWTPRRPMWISPTPSDKSTVPGEQRLRGYRKAAGRAGEEAAHRRQEGAVGGLVDGTANLSSEHGDLVAERKKFDLVGALRAHHHDNKSEHVSEGEVDKSPKPAARPVPSHPAHGNPCDWAPGNSCSTTRSGIRIVRASLVDVQ